MCPESQSSTSTYWNPSKYLLDTDAAVSLLVGNHGVQGAEDEEPSCLGPSRPHSLHLYICLVLICILHNKALILSTALR